MINYDYTYENIVECLKNVGLIKNDNIFIHSNLGFFGKLKNSTNSVDYYNNFKNAIFEVIGKNGTLIVPTFTYSFFNKEKFDLLISSSKCGIFSEMLRLDSQSLRSMDPNFSISAIGENAEFFTKNETKHSFGPNSFWEKFLRINGKICNFNFDSGSTFFHYVEKILNVPYRYDKYFSGKIIKEKNMIEETWSHFVFDHEKKNHFPNFEKFSTRAKTLELIKISNLGKGQITCISSKDIFSLIQNELKTNPAFLIDGPV
jgi:aminoglycoside 3-N-acetyltransferase